MRGFLLILVLQLTTSLFSQTSIYELFDRRMPSARAEAMGRSFGSIDGDLASIYFNPAGTATINRFQLNTSIASPNYTAKEARFSFFSAGIRISKKSVISISHHHYSTRENLTIIDLDFNTLGTIVPVSSSTSFNLSTELVKGLFVGLNANYFYFKPNENDGNTMYYDIGAIKKFEFNTTKHFSHSLNIGASYKNFSKATLNLNVNNFDRRFELDYHGRVGASYQLSLNKKSIKDTLETLKVLVQADYIGNSSFGTGTEIVLYDLLALRAGYYRSPIYNFLPYIDPSRKNSLNVFTYGFGIQAPLHKITNIPLNLSFDYTSLPQPSYYKNDNWDNFNTYTIKVNWII